MENIVIAVITSITSIIVTLITAGYFKKFLESRHQAFSKKKLMGQIKKDEIIHITMEELKEEYDADRVYIIQFHNGGMFYTNSPMQKASITYERCSAGLKQLSERMINFFVSHYTMMIKNTIENKLFCTNVSLIDDVPTRALLRKAGTQAVAAVPIYDKASSKFGTPDGNLIAILVLDWVFSDVPQEYIAPIGACDADGCCFSQEFKNKLLKNGESIAAILN